MKLRAAKIAEAEASEELIQLALQNEWSSPGVIAHALSLPEGPFRTGLVMGGEREAITELVLARSRS